jgi:hypothetical protein
MKLKPTMIERNASPKTLTGITVRTQVRVGMGKCQECNAHYADQFERGEISANSYRLGRRYCCHEHCCKPEAACVNA